MSFLKTVKSIHDFTKNFLANWFPKLPFYEGFLFRINNLDKVFPELSNKLLQDKKFNQLQNNPEKLVVEDSLPIMLAKNFRAHKCNKAYRDQKTKKKLNRIGSDLHAPTKLSKFKKTLRAMKKFIQNLSAQYASP